MLKTIGVIWTIFAVLFAIAGTMRASAKYDVMDHTDIRKYNIKEMWLLVWDHREDYYAAAGCLAVALICLVSS